jgi:hypothetical protein
MLTLPTPLDAMNRLGRALADPARCRILRDLLDVVLAVDESKPCADDLPVVRAPLPARSPG